MRRFVQIVIILLVLSLLSGSANGTQIINLVLNPGAELGYAEPDSWKAIDHAVWSEGGHSGLHCFGLDDDGTWESNPIIINTESKCNFSFWVKSQRITGTFFVHLRQWSEVNGTGWVDQINFLLSGNYTDWTVVKEDNIQFQATTKSITIIFGNDSPSTGDLYVDDYHLSDVLERKSVV